MTSQEEKEVVKTPWDGGWEGMSMSSFWWLGLPRLFWWVEGWVGSRKIGTFFLGCRADSRWITLPYFCWEKWDFLQRRDMKTRTWRVTTVVDATEKHPRHFDGVVRAWPPWLPFTLVDAVVCLLTPQGQDPAPASGTAGGWWPSADSISANGLSWREPPGSLPKQHLPQGYAKTHFPQGHTALQGHPASSCLWIRWGLCCQSLLRLPWSIPVTAPVTVDPQRAPSKLSTHRSSSQSVSWELLSFSCSVESDSATPRTAAQ